MRLESPRTIIRPMTTADVTDRFVSWFADSEVMEHLHMPMNLKRKRLVEVVGILESSTSYLFAIDWKENGQQIGWLQALCSSDGTAKITHAIGEQSYWGRGITPEFLTVLIEYFFDVVGLNKIVSRVFVDNVRNQRVNEKLGFRFEETVPGRGRRPNGGLYDVHVYGLLKEEWRAGRDD